MSKRGIVATGVAVGLLAFFPAAAFADEDELDVTMEVLDDVADIDGHVIVMPEFEDGFGPSEDHFGEAGGDEREDGEVADRGEESDRGSDEESEDDAGAKRDFAGDGFEDDFAHDEDFESDDDEEHAEDESDFDEGDSIDTDEPDEEPMEDDEPMHDEESLEGDGESDLVKDDLVSLLAD